MPRQKDTRLQRMIGVGVGLALLGAIAFVFRSGVDDSAISFWQYVMLEGVTRGSVRLLVIALSLYGIVSVPVLLFRGRWIRSVGPSGITVDESPMSTEEGRRLSLAIAAIVEEVKDVKALLRRMQRGTID